MTRQQRLGGATENEPKTPQAQGQRAKWQTVAIEPAMLPRLVRLLRTST